MEGSHDHTRDILVQYQVLVNHIVYQAFTVLVEDKHFPLLVLLFSLRFVLGAGVRTSPLVIWRIVWRITMSRQL